MKQVKCINTKNYKLTLNSNYLVEQDGNNFYRVTNDSGKLVRYAVELFEDVVNEIVPPIPIAPIVIPRTEQDCINSINVETSVIGGTTCNYTVKYVDLNNENVEFSGNVIIKDTYFSCGVKQFEGLTNLANNILQHVKNDEQDLDLLIEIIFKRVLNETIEEFLNVNGTETRFVLFSTNKIENHEDFYIMLDDLADSSTEWKENPNSDNEIKIWVVDYDNLL